LGVANESHKLATGSGSNCLVLCVLIHNYPSASAPNLCLSRGGPKPRVPVPWCRRKGLVRAPVCTPNPAPPPPHTRGRGGTTRGSSASQPPVVFRPYPPPVGGWGRLGASSWPQIRRWDRRRGAAGGFLGPREGQKSVGFCPLGGAHQSAWSLYIMLGHTPRRRRPVGA
jgi:hypothetical protein